MQFEDLILEVTDSTNRAARELAEKNAPHGSGVLARKQTAGRGRLDRSWFSACRDDLFCSYVFKPDIELSEYPKLTLVAGLAAAEFLKRTILLEVGLKWPNDLYLSGKKFGGILCETYQQTVHPQSRYAIIGLGINLNLQQEDLPEYLQGGATSVIIEGGPSLEPHSVFAGLREELLAYISLFQRDGFAAILKRWHAFDILYGRSLEWLTQDGVHIAGICRGLSPDGLLRVETEDGTTHHVLTGDVRLNR